MSRLSVIARIIAGLVSTILLVTLVDDLGKFRWFWPYDHEIYGAAFGIGVLWYIFYGPQIAAWAEEEQAKLDREEDGSL